MALTMHSITFKPNYKMHGLSEMAAFCIYTHRSPANAFCVRWQKLIGQTQKTALALLYGAVSALQRPTTIAGGENGIHDSRYKGKWVHGLPSIPLDY